MRLTAIISAALLLGAASGAQATELIQNGSFSQVSGTVAGLQNGPHSGAEIGPDWNYGQALPGWTSLGGANNQAFNLYFFGDGSEKTKDADTQYGESGQHPNVNYTGASPDGGAFMVLDGDPNFTGALTQTVSGLKIGQTYELSFYWAGGELADRTGFNSSQLDVTFGGSVSSGVVTGGVTQDTATYFNTNPPNGTLCNTCGTPGSFSGWKKEYMTFTANAPSELISFLSVGTPDANLPPIALLDGVSLAIPEPAAWVLLVLGFGSAGAMIRRRRRLAAI
jgi:hypothetical protein